MQYKTLGRTNLQVSVIGFGGAPIGLPGYLGKEDRDSPEFRAAARLAVQTAVQKGVNYFDTAPGYGQGRSERYIGEALEPHRDRVILATKYSWETTLTPQARTDALRESLERLRTKSVDVLQLHGFFFGDETADRILGSDLLDWADEMRSRGLCRFTGITAEGPSGALERLMRTGRFDVIEIAYNLIYQSTCDYQRDPAGIIPLAKSLGMGVTTMRAPTSGFLQRLLGQAFGLDARAVTRLAINYVLSTPEVDCAVIGMKNIDEVTANCELAGDLSSRLDIKALHDRYA